MRKILRKKIIKRTGILPSSWRGKQSASAILQAKRSPSPPSMQPGDPRNNKTKRVQKITKNDENLQKKCLKRIGNIRSPPPSLPPPVQPAVTHRTWKPNPMRKVTKNDEKLQKKRIQYYNYSLLPPSPLQPNDPYNKATKQMQGNNWNNWKITKKKKSLKRRGNTEWSMFSADNSPLSLLLPPTSSPVTNTITVKGYKKISKNDGNLLHNPSYEQEWSWSMNLAKTHEPKNRIREN